MGTRRQVVSLVVTVLAISAIGVGFTTVGGTSSTDRPETGQVPTATTTSAAGQTAPGQSADPITYRVTVTSESAVNRTQLSQYGDVGTQSGNHIEVTLTRANATRVANLSWVKSITLARQAVAADGASSANYGAVRAGAQQSAFPTGDGVEVGVIDFGFNTSSGVIADQVVSYRSFRDSPGDPSHGTMVAEVVATGAPNSSLHLVSVRTGVDTEAAISALIEQDVDIIVMSVIWFEDDDGDHFLTDNVTIARKQGVLFVNSAGNLAQRSWEGEFQSTDGDQFHEWAPNGDELNCIPNCETPLEGKVFIRLDWENDGDQSQYRVELYNPVTNETIAASTAVTEKSAILETNIRRQPIDLVVQNTEGPADDEIEVTVFRGPGSIEYSVPASSLGPPADVPSVLSVAAYEPDNNRIAPYSSQGPTDTGQRGIDITGYTNLQLSNGTTFSGTSAAAPYVAFVAALVQDASSDDLPPDELEAVLTETAIDLGPTGPDPISGAGLVNRTAAVASVQPENDRFEPNDKAVTATTIQPGTYQNLQIVRRDWDYFAVDLAANTSLTATAQFSHRTGNLELGLYGPDGELLAGSTSMTDNETVQINRTATAGTYYLLVTGATNDTVAPYSLTVETEQQVSTPTASVHIANQTTGGATVSVARATLPAGGFVGIHDSTLVSQGAVFDSLRGTSAYLSAGSHADILVNLSQPYDEGGTIIALLYRDTNNNEQYDFVNSDGATDSPYTDSQGNIVTSSAQLMVSAINLRGPESVTVSPGETATVTYTVANNGTSDVASLLVAPTTTPAGITVLDVEAPEATRITDNTAFFTNLTPGSAYTVTVTYDISANVTTGGSLGARTETNSGASDTVSVPVSIRTSVVAQYDEDDSGTIDNRELLAALADYPEQVSNRELLTLLSVYRP